MKTFLRQLGPGILFAGAAIGVSHLVQSTRGGAEFGFGLLWALFLVHLFKYPFFQFGPRYAMATGDSLLEGYRKLGKPVLFTYFVLNLATMFTIQTAVTIVTAGLAASLFGITTHPISWSILLLIVSGGILIIGKYQFLDKFMKYIVVALSICTIAAVIIAAPNSVETLELSQIIPADTAGIAFLIAFMGWMPAPLDISVWHSIWALEKQKVQKSYTIKHSISDFNIGYVCTIITGILFISLGALILYQSGEELENGATQFAFQFIDIYTNTLGPSVYYIIAIAAFAAMFSTTLTTLDASPRAMASATSLLFGTKSKYNTISWLILLITGTICMLLFLLSEMVTLVTIATILSFVTAPFYAIVNYILVSSKHMPEKWRPSRTMHILSWMGILFLIGFSIWYLSTL